MRHEREHTDRTDWLTFYRTTDGTSHTMVPVLAKDGAEPCAVPKPWDSNNLIKPRNKLTGLIDGFSKSNCADRIADYELWGGEHEVNVAYSARVFFMIVIISTIVSVVITSRIWAQPAQDH
uniref:Uncharacterized protein n=1 Tax=Anopheles merus TaxID=30066 RepID=A0A182US84_ANOME